MKLFSKNPKLNQAEKDKLSAQQLIPIKAVDSGVILTRDKRLVLILKVDAINTELLSNTELAELLEDYEAVLKSINYEVQTNVVSQPLDLNQYIQGEKERLKTTKNFYKKKLLTNYIDYCDGMQRNKTIIQRQRFINFDVKIKETTLQAYQNAMSELEERGESLIQSLKEMDLTAAPLTDVETIQYMHIFFDFEGAQNTPIQSANIPPIILGGHSHDNEFKLEVAATKEETN